jgi:two-component system sensor histidine kinase AlgZ
MPSISQHHRHPDRLPDFANMGVWLRTVLIVTTLTFGVTVAIAPGWRAVPEEFSIVSMHAQPVVVLTLMALAAAAPFLRRVSYVFGVAATLALAAAAALTLSALAEALFSIDGGTADRQIFFAMGTAAVVLFYFHLRGRALSPALTEARLQALQARIRPHFLFNSLNAVLSLVRTDPRRAETALEDMADLFRTFMADNRDLVPLEREVELCRQYLDIEQLRLGDRLRVEWHADNMPRDALVPPLLLQPLLENAVYHGIEPSTAPGTVVINIFRSRGEVHMVLRNPYRAEAPHQHGNRMALGNIRERLALHFDDEGRLETQVRDGAYQVHIRIPYRGEAPA